MKKQCFVQVLCMIFLISTAAAQGHPVKTYRNFPLVLSIQFHSLSYPLKDFRANFKNIGLGIGTEIALGSTHNWAQQFQLSWYRNKEAGNGMLLYTQSAWRPTIVAHMYTELKAGFGLHYNFRPVESFRQQDGKWASQGHKGKWMFMVPVGVSLGYNNFSENTYAAPFVSYQLLLNASYNKDVPVITNSLFQVGTRIHLSSKK